MPTISTNFLVHIELFSVASLCSQSSFTSALEGKDIYFSLWWSSLNLMGETIAQMWFRIWYTQQRALGRNVVLMAKQTAQEASCWKETDFQGPESYICDSTPYCCFRTEQCVSFLPLLAPATDCSTKGPPWDYEASIVVLTRQLPLSTQRIIGVYTALLLCPKWVYLWL